MTYRITAALWSVCLTAAIAGFFAAGIHGLAILPAAFLGKRLVELAVGQRITWEDEDEEALWVDRSNLI